MIDLFSKRSRVKGRALVASAEAKPLFRRSFWYFFLRLHSQEKVRIEFVQCQKRTVVEILCEKTLAVLFEQKGTKRTKNAVYGVSPVATGDEGYAPSTCAAF